jgi:hypothetical protein
MSGQPTGDHSAPPPRPFARARHRSPESDELDDTVAIGPVLLGMDDMPHQRLAD